MAGKSVRNRTTNKDFDLFQNEVHKWMDIFGLYSWSLDIVHDNLTDDSCAKGSILADPTNRVAEIGLSSVWETNVTDEEIKITAFHEVMELFLVRIGSIAESRCILPREIEEETHCIIRTLENILYPKY